MFPRPWKDWCARASTGFSRATRAALLLVAAIGRPFDEMLARVGINAEDLEPAFVARVVERDDAVVQFTHPLLASVLYQSTSAEERLRAHGRVAAVVEDPLDRGHLALSTDSADSEIAADLEKAAALASTRAAPIAAAELGEQALRLTPSDAQEDGHRRAIAAARATWRRASCAAPARSPSISWDARQ